MATSGAGRKHPPKFYDQLDVLLNDKPDATPCILMKVLQHFFCITLGLLAVFFRAFGNPVKVCPL